MWWPGARRSADSCWRAGCWTNHWSCTGPKKVDRSHSPTTALTGSWNCRREKLVGYDVQCPYHGMQFGTDGNCTKIPTQTGIPSAMQVRSFSLIEKGLWTWIWMGDPLKANPDMNPDTGYVKEHFSKGFQFCFPCRGNFVRLHENLLDTSHPSFLHAGAFDDGDLADSSFKVEWKGQMVRLVRRSRQPVLPGPGTIRTFNLEPGQRVIRTLVTETHAPCLNTIMNTFENVPASRRRRQQKRCGPSPHNAGRRPDSHDDQAVSR